LGNGEEYAAVAYVAEIPVVVPSARRDVAEGEVGGAGESMSDSSIGVGLLDSSEAVKMGLVAAVEYAQEERSVEGAVAAEEGGVADEAAEGDARGGRAGEVGRGADAEEDLFQRPLLSHLPRDGGRRPFFLFSLAAAAGTPSSFFLFFLAAAGGAPFFLTASSHFCHPNRNRIGLQRN
jgi:hypothetical protein